MEKKDSILDNTYREYAKEIVKQYDLLNGFSGLTKSYAKVRFIEDLYDNKEYPIHLSLSFHPNQFKTIANQNSVYNELKLISEGKAPIKDFKKIIDSGFENIYKYKPSINKAHLAFDFSADITKDLINNYGNNGKILDPCHGWGGRMIGFMLSNATYYHGIDSSKEQSAGVKEIWTYFKDALTEKKEVELLCEKFEDINLKENYYDFSITSPPYYDYEKYLGENQSYNMYKTYNEWITNFLEPLIKKVYKSLKTNGHFAIKVGNLQYPLIDNIKDITKELNFELIETKTNKSGKLYSTLSTSVILVFKKK